MREDRLSWERGQVQISQCADCQHKHLGSVTCDAFPDGIPKAILVGEHDHTERYPGDNGIRYRPMNKGKT